MYVSEYKQGLNYREDVSQARTSVQLVWICERESNFGKLALDDLEQEGFTARTISMWTGVIQQVKQLHPFLVIIEATMSRGRALDLCREIRWMNSLARTPIVLVSTNASEEECVLGLESGADDYIAQACSGRELVARVRAVIRRFAREGAHSRTPLVSHAFLRSSIGTPSPIIRIGDIEIDPAAMKISVRGSEVVTTNLEFRLLHYLLHNRGRVFTREQLLDAVWGAQFVELRSVDACVRRLRRKLELEPLRPAFLKTVRGAGYCLEVNTVSAVPRSPR